MQLQAKDQRSHQKVGEKLGTDSPSELPEGSNPANTLILSFWPPELSQNKILLSNQACGNWYSNPSKLQSPTVRRTLAH